nr:unnamed protein product [Callosobruchus analis]
MCAVNSSCIFSVRKDFWKRIRHGTKFIFVAFFPLIMFPNLSSEALFLEVHEPTPTFLLLLHHFLDLVK